MDLVEELRGYGLTTQEAKVYLTLIKFNDAKVSELAKLSNVERSECYQVLKKLRSRGLVKISGGQPRRFRYYPPDAVLSKLIRDREKDIDVIESAKWDTIKSLEAVASMEMDERSEGERFSQNIVKITGKENILHYINRLIERCQKRGLSILSARGVRGGLNILKNWEKIIREKHLSIRILATVTEDNIEQAKQLAKFAEVRHLDNIKSRMTVSDNADIIITLSEEANLPATAMFIRSEDQMKILFELFDAAWELSTPLQLRIRQLEKKIKISESKAIKGEEDVSNIMKGMLKRANNSIILLADKRFLRKILPFLRSEIIPKTQNGMKLTILTNSVEILSNLKNTLNLDLRYFDNPRSRIIITEREVLIGALTGENYPAEAVWSNHNGIVSVMKDVTRTHLEKSTFFPPGKK